MRKLISIVPLTCLVCSAHTLADYYEEYRLLDRVAGAAFRQPSKAEESVAALTAILNLKVGPQLHSLAELSRTYPDVVGKMAWTSTEARCRAATKLGEMRVTSAEDALRAFQLDPDHRARDFDLLACTQSALIELRVAAGASISEKIQILEGYLDFSIHMYGIDMPVRDSVREHLCDLGAANDLPLISQGMREARNDVITDERIAFCQARIDVIARNPDRVKALATLLFPNGPNGPLPPGQTPSMTDEQRKADELRGWAMWQLAGMHTAEADEVLTRYFAAVEKLDRQHPLHYESVFQVETLNEMWNAYGKYF